MDLKKEMVIIEKELTNSDKETRKQEFAQKLKLEKIAIQKAMITPINMDHTKDSDRESLKVNRTDKNETTSLIEQSEKFATIIASLVDGGAPVLGSILPLLPFFFGTELSPFHFIFSYAVLVGILVYLGIFLGSISGVGRVKYIFHLVTAGITTLIVSLLLELAISP